MKHIVYNLKTYLLMGFCISIAFISCEDNHDDLGVDIHPDNERLLVVSDSSAEIKIYAVNTENKINANQNYALLGHVFDPLLGDYQSSFIANARPRVLSLDLGDSVLIDSLFLYVKYDTIYGENNIEQKMFIYEMFLDSNLYVEDLDGLPDDISSISNYYDAANMLVETSYTPKYRDSLTESLPSIRIDLLQNEKGWDLAKRLVLSEDSLYNHQPWVQQYIFNGLFFESEKRTTEGAIVRVLASDSTRLTISYRKLTIDTLTNDFDTSTVQALSFDFHSSYRANVYDRTFNSDVQIFDTITEPEMEEIDSTMFLQGMNGLNGKIIITGFLDSIMDIPHIAINRAFISIQVEDSLYLDATKYPILPSFYVTVDDDNPTLDELWVSNGGTLTYNPVDYYQGYYSFAITSRVVQYLEEGTNKMVLNLYPSNNSYSPQRVGLKGMENQTYAVKLRLSYTKINTD